MDDSHARTGSVSERWNEYLADLQSGRSRFLPLPWPALEQVIRLGLRRKVGIVAQRGTREATVGRRIASYIAGEVGHVLLCTSYPPPEQERLHVLDDEKLTPEAVNAKVRWLIGKGAAPVLIVVERYERMRLTERAEELSRGDELEWCGRAVDGQYDTLDIPALFTTAVDQEPVTDKWLRSWAGVDSPGNVMTDFCRTVLVVHRLDDQRVRVRTELDSDEYAHPAVNDVVWPYA